MKPPAKRLILITGCPRSGTTAVGEALSRAPGAVGLHEPLNHHVGIREVERYFEIVGSTTFSREKLERILTGMSHLDLNYKPGTFPRENAVTRWVKRHAGGRARMSYYRARVTPNANTIMWKDPFAVFMTHALAEDYAIDVVLTVRNPWAVAASFKRLAWGFDLRDISERLRWSGLDTTLSDPALREASERSALNGAALWSMAYGLAAQWATHPRVRLLDIEELVQQPMAQYESLYRSLGLEWNEAVTRGIQRQYRSKGGVVAPAQDKAFDRNRDLSKINQYWRDVLEPREVDWVHEHCGDLWARLQTTTQRPMETAV